MLKDKLDGPPSTEPSVHRIVMLCHPELMYHDAFYFPELLAGFESMIKDVGLFSNAYSYDDAEAAAIPEGTIVAFVVTGDYQEPRIDALIESGCRLVAINGYHGNHAIPCVRIDDVGAAEQAVDHLVALGHERIGFIMGPTRNLDATSRRDGFRAAVKRHGLTVAPEAGIGFQVEFGYEAARELLDLPVRPTAFVCASDLSAMGAIQAARDCSLSVPMDLSVVGFGDFPVIDYVYPRVTTIRQPRFDLGRAAAAAVIALVKGEPACDALLKAELIVHELSVSPSPLTRM